LCKELTWERRISGMKKAADANHAVKSDEAFDPREKVQPIELAHAKEHDAFFTQVLEKDEDALERYWIKLQYQSAIKRPKRVGTAERVIKYTAALKGCVGYINARDLDEQARKLVKVVFVLEI